MTEGVKQNSGEEAPNLDKGTKESIGKTKVMFVDNDRDGPEFAWMEFKLDDPNLSEHFDVSYLLKAKSLADAVERILKNNPNIIFMDNDLGGEFNGPHGPDIVRALREAGFAGAIMGNSGEGSKPFEKKGVAGMMDGFLPDKGEGLGVFLKDFIAKRGGKQ